MSKIRFLAAAFLCTVFLSGLAADEYTSGLIKLVLRENNGRFSLYMQDSHSRYEPVFTDLDPRSSFLAVMVNDRSYKLGDTSNFKIKLGTNPDKPSLIFESSFLRITEEFSFIKTSNSSAVNGVSITITLENKAAQQSMVGLRYLLDTSLGEDRREPPFITNTKIISSETLVEKGSADRYWISENDTLSLMGSISSPDGPDSIHFANWKRLNDVSWKAPYSPGRNFNSPPYSFGDSAVCYYFEPRALNPGETRTVSFTLTAAGITEEGFPFQMAAGPALNPEPALSPEEQKETDLALILQLMDRIDEYVSSGNATDEELYSVEYTLNQLLAKYGMGPNTSR